MRKTVKFLTIGMLFIGMTTIIGCKKEDMSKYATKEDLNNYATNDDIPGSFKAKEFDFSITFNPGDTYGNGPTIHKDNPNDVVLTFVKWDDLGGDPTWVQCPVTSGNLKIVPEFLNYSLFINVLKADGTSGSPITQTMKLGFRAIVIPVSGLAQHPDTDLTDYKEVSKAFKLD